MSEEKEETKVEDQVKGLSQEQALNLLVQAVKLAQKRGAFELEETELLLQAVRVFTAKS